MKIKTAWYIGQGIGRFILGRNGVLTGDRKTNATFWTPATRSLDPSGKALRWEMMRGASRLAWRFGVCYFFLLLPFGVIWPRLLQWHAGAMVLGYSLYLCIRGIILHGYRLPLPVRREKIVEEEGEEQVSASWGLEWMVREGRQAWEQEKVFPVATAAASILAVSWTEKDKRRYVHVPRNYQEPGGPPVEILLPPSFTGADAGVQTRLMNSVSARLGIREPMAEWSLEGSAPRALIRTQPAPPPLVRFEEVRQYFEAAEPYNPFYGLTAGSVGLNIGMHSDTPHLAISAGSGAGKSEMIKDLVMQALRWGWSVIILDWKEESQEWCKGLQGVRYYVSEEAIHDAGVAIGEEISWRKENPDAPRVPILVVCEEWSMTADLLSEYWSILRSTTPAEERASMPVRSPALTAFKKMIFTGRSLGLFQLLVAIRFSARVTGGNADLRESFQVILMARYKSQTVNMLAKGIKPFPKNKPREVGRWVAVMGEEAVIFRAPLVTDEEAREWSMGGVESPGSPFSVRGTLRSDVRQEATLGVTGGSLEIESGRKASLSEMLEELKDVDASITLKILQKAAQDADSGFPGMLGVGKFGAYLYKPADVRLWVVKRYVRKLRK